MTIKLTAAGVLSCHVALQRTESPRDRKGTIGRIVEALGKVTTPVDGGRLSSNGGDIELDKADAEYLSDLINRVPTWPHEILSMDGGPDGALEALKTALAAKD